MNSMIRPKRHLDAPRNTGCWSYESVRFGSVRLSSVRFGLLRCTAVYFGVLQCRAVRCGAMYRIGVDQCESVRMESPRVESSLTAIKKTFRRRRQEPCCQQAVQPFFLKFFYVGHLCWCGKERCAQCFVPGLEEGMNRLVWGPLELSRV